MGCILAFAQLGLAQKPIGAPKVIIQPERGQNNGSATRNPNLNSTRRRAAMPPEKSIVLSRMSSVGNVVKSPDGTIHVSCGFTTVRFHEQNFIDFTLMLKMAFSALTEEGLNHILDPDKPLNPPAEPPA